MFISGVLVLTMIVHLCIPLTFSQGAKISVSNFCCFGLPWWLSGIESTCNTGDSGSIPESGRFLWRRKSQPIQVSLSGQSHGQRNLEVYSPWGHKESDMTYLLKKNTQKLEQ